MFNRNHSLQGNYILTFTGEMLSLQCNIDLKRNLFFIIIIILFLDKTQMRNGKG